VKSADEGILDEGNDMDISFEPHEPHEAPVIASSPTSFPLPATK
jgi:hypothetical protein